jgi:hypothetical protein
VWSLLRVNLLSDCNFPAVFLISSRGHARQAVRMVNRWGTNSVEIQGKKSDPLMSWLSHIRDLMRIEHTETYSPNCWQPFSLPAMCSWTRGPSLRTICSLQPVYSSRTKVIPINRDIHPETRQSQNTLTLVSSTVHCPTFENHLGSTRKTERSPWGTFEHS